jgi:hypothetical protein
MSVERVYGVYEGRDGDGWRRGSKEKVKRQKERRQAHLYSLINRGEWKRQR